MRYQDKDKTFYKSKEWKAKRLEVLKLDKFECQECKKHGRITKANTVHHRFLLEKYPEHGLDIYVGSKRNLISLCHECHEKAHGYRKKDETPLTEEKWQKKNTPGQKISRFK